MADTNDLSAGFQEHRQHLAQATAAEELLSRVKSAEAPKPAKPGAEAATEETGGKIARTAKDIGKGVFIESPRAVITGFHDAIAETYDVADSLAGWLEQKLHLPGGIKVSAGIPGPRVEFISSKERDRLKAAGKDIGTTVGQALHNFTIEDPESNTGKLIKGVAQFLLPFSKAGKLRFLRGAETTVGKIGQAAGRGAIADFTAFDAHQDRLSNLVQEYPALQNPVNEYLAAKPEDNEAEGRFKNALEGLGLGQVAEGLTIAIRGLKGLSGAKQALTAADTEARRTLPDNAFRDLGDESAESTKLVAERKPEKITKAEAEAAQLTPEQVAQAEARKPDLFINFARIDTPDDVKRVMQEVADANKAAIDKKRRGVQTFEQTKLNAQQQDAWKTLNERRAGEPLNAEQSVAARELWVTSAERLRESAEKAAQDPSEGNLFAFRKMMAVHHAIQAEVVAARTETARALGSWRIPVGGSAERLRDITAALDAHGGADVSRDLAERIATLAKTGHYKEMDRVIEKTAYAKTRDAVLEGWINGLLSSPQTHVANTVSNTSVMFLRMAERATAAKIAATLGDETSVQAGEAAAQWFGLVSGFKDALRYSGKALMSGESGMGLGKLELPREGAISSEAFGVSSSGWLGRGLDLAGGLTRIPGRALTAEDEFFKTLGYRMELHSQALRQATQEVNAGKVAPDAFKQRIAELVETPPENLRMAATDAALYQTFTNAPGKIGKSIGQLTSQYPLLKVILPFTRTPANILRFTFERTPLAPISRKFRADVAAGGSRRDLALAQMGLGTGVMFSMADLAMNGQVTGRGPPEKGQRLALERTGWKPYSVNVNGKWYTYNRLDPLGSIIGMTADLVETMRNGQAEIADEATMEEAVVAGTLAVAGNVVNKTYLSGLSDFFEMMADPGSAGEAKIQRLVGSVIPAGVNAANKLQDPYMREVNSMMDAIRARTPGLSDNLPARRNLWGEPLNYESGNGKAFDLFSPVYTKPGVHEAIDDELLRIGSNVTMPPRRTSFDGVTVDLSQHPGAYSRYVELAGNGLKHPAWGLGAKDLLNQVVSGKHPLSQIYAIKSDGPEGGKDVYLKSIITQYREMARRQLIEEFPDIKADVDTKKAKQRELKLPVLTGG